MYHSRFGQIGDVSETLVINDIFWDITERESSWICGTTLIGGNNWMVGPIIGLLFAVKILV